MRPPGDTGTAGPLAGLRVIELGTLIAGPFAGKLLADMGAEVIKVEPPGKPDPMRDWGRGHYKGRALWWPVQSRNKKLVTLDLKKQGGPALLLRLAERSDAIVENFRPGTLESWNLGFDRLREANRAMILVRVSGYGQSGPYSDRAGYASVAEAMGGLRFINGFPGQPPPRSGISLGDSLAAMFAVQGLLAAVYRRAATGTGQVVDVSLMESCFAMLESIVPEYDRLGQVREPSGTGLRGLAPSNLFRSKDGKWVVIAANQDTVFRRLCTAMGRPDLIQDERFSTHSARAENQDDIEGIVADWAAAHDAREIDAVLNEAGVVCGPVYSVADIFEDPQYRARDMLVDHDDPETGRFVGPGVVPKFSDTPGAVRWSGEWEPGVHNRDVWGGLVGLSDQEIDELVSEGVL
ncbi:MAG: CoA transferase [Actinobacteria bacterium]|nr:CoA transferase [Actinomycetota bacterium]